LSGKTTAPLIVSAAIRTMFWHRVRLSWSIRGSPVANTPMTGTFGEAFLMFGSFVASTFFAISGTPSYASEIVDLGLRS